MESITLLHLNDIYNAEKSSRFLCQWKNTKKDEEDAGRECLSFFSGDAWSPSVMTSIVRGKQMVPVLNAMQLDAACLGNHDLDLGLAEFSILRDKCTFPWICSNVKHKGTMEPLGGCKEYVVVESKNGKAKFLVLGLVEADWIDTLSTIEPDDVSFEYFTEYIKRRVPELVTANNIDSVIALSHMRMPNDYRLARQCGGYIDIILGGHDHHYEDSTINDIRILNSGTDFSDFSVIQIHGRIDEARTGGESNVLLHPLRTTSRRVTIDPNSDMKDLEIEEALKDIQELVMACMDDVIGATNVDLDARFSEIRTKETNISNLIANVMRRATRAQVAILNAGSLRADRIIPKGPFTVKDLNDLLPMADTMAVAEVTGEDLLKALENGVSKYPAMEGRFPCVDGVRFSFDPNKPEGARVVEGSVTVAEKDSNELQPLDLSKKYTVASKTYLLNGKDGYESFAGAPIVLDDESCTTLPIMLRNLFTEICVLKMWEGMTVKATVISAAGKFKRLIRRSVVNPYAIAPVVDGRITNIQETVLAS